MASQRWVATVLAVSCCPSISTLECGPLLLPLARAHGVPLGDLEGPPPTGDPRIHLRPIIRHGRTVVPLTRRVGGVQAYKQVIPASRAPANHSLRTPGLRMAVRP